MTDILRLVTIDETSSPVILSNLENNAGGIWKMRDTFKVAGAPRSFQTEQNPTRYGGQRNSGDSMQSATMGASWMIVGSSADNCLQKLEDLLEIADKAYGPARALFLQWQPDGATRASYIEIRGTPTYTPVYQWVKFKEYKIQIDVSWPTAPLTEELRMTWWDDFRPRTALGTLDMSDQGYQHTGAWTFATASTGNLRLPTTPLTGQDAVIWNNDRHEFVDGEVTVKGQQLSGALGTAAAQLNPGLKFLVADGSYVYATMTATGAVEIRSVVAGVATQRAISGTTTSPALNTSHWVRVRSEGNNIIAEYFASEPSPVRVPTLTTTWANADAQGFGLTRNGFPVINSTIPTSSANKMIERVDVKPYTYRNVACPAEISLPALPGNAPAQVDFESSQDVAETIPWPFMLVAWRPTRAGDATLANTKKTVRFEAESPIATGGTRQPATLASGTASGGNVLEWKSNASGQIVNSYAYWYIDQTIWTADDFSNDALVQVWGRMYWTDPPTSWTLTVSTTSSVNINLGTKYSLEYGATGLTLPDAAVVGASFRMIPLGTIAVDPRNPQPLALRINVLGSAAATGDSLGLDYLVLTSSRRQWSTPTGKPRSSGYAFWNPTFDNTVGTRRILYSDLSSGISGGVQSSNPLPSAVAAGGAPFEPDPGATSVYVMPNLYVPADTTTNTASDILSSPTSVNFAVTPRHRLAAV